MKNLRRKFDIFCFRNRNKGIPNLMLYLTLGSAMVYLFTTVTQNTFLYELLSFNREKILQGQVWRLFSYPLTSASGNLVMTLIFLVCYYSLGRAMENVWGTLRFNLYYLSGVVLMDLYALVFGGTASAYYLNLSLFLGYATLYPDSQFLFLFIIPVKAWIFAVLTVQLLKYCWNWTRLLIRQYKALHTIVQAKITILMMFIIIIQGLRNTRNTARF